MHHFFRSCKAAPPQWEIDKKADKATRSGANEWWPSGSSELQVATHKKQLTEHVTTKPRSKSNFLFQDVQEIGNWSKSKESLLGFLRALFRFRFRLRLAGLRFGLTSSSSSSSSSSSASSCSSSSSSSPGSSSASSTAGFFLRWFSGMALGFFLFATALDLAAAGAFTGFMLLKRQVQWNMFSIFMSMHTWILKRSASIVLARDSKLLRWTSCWVHFTKSVARDFFSSLAQVTTIYPSHDITCIPHLPYTYHLNNMFAESAC